MGGALGYHVRVRVHGQLSSAWWSGLFANLAVTTEPDGTSLICGDLPDQSAVHGLLGSIRDTGLSLVSVEATTSPPTGGATASRPAPRSPR